MRENHAVIHIALAFRNSTQLALQQSLSQRSYTVNMNVTLKMVVFVLNDA